MTEKLRTPDGAYYANEEAKIVWETVAEVREFTRGIPEELPLDELRKITFKRTRKLNQHRGLTAILVAGTVFPTYSVNVFEVPKRTLGILDALKIRYRYLTEERR